MKKAWQIVISIIMLFAVLAISLIATMVLNNQQKNTEHQETTEIINYGVDGKQNGGVLTSEPILTTEDHIIFEDRVLERFAYDNDGIQECTDILSNAMNSIPEGVNKFLMFVPTRISLEDNYHQYTDDINEAIDEIYTNMPSDVSSFDIMTSLKSHSNEYLFFRTDHTWTALGAYYAAKEFCQGIGIDIKSLEEYRERRFENYVGTMRTLPNTKSLADNPDYVSYYIKRDAANEQTITARCNENEYITYDSPTVALSRGGYDIFVGSYFSHSILHGDAGNGKTLMIVGDEYSKAFAPWLTPYFESICLVDPSYFNGESKEFWQLFSGYNITDFLILEYGKNLGKSVINSRIRALSANGPLSSDPLYVNEDHIIFEDRAFERYHYDGEDIQIGAEMIDGAMTALPNSVNKYLMLVPMHIELQDEKYTAYSDSSTNAIQKMFLHMPDDVVPIDTTSTLSAHKDEYLYFRTDHVWTALGARYAAEEFCKKAGIGMVGINEYTVKDLQGYLGSMRTLDKAGSLSKYPDYVSYYILDDAANEQFAMYRKSSNEYYETKVPVVDAARKGYDTFIGSYYSHTILKGDVANDKTLMIIGDEYSKALAPWLTPYFENVCLIDPNYFYGGSEEFWQLFKDYQVTDLLIIEYPKSFGRSTTNRRLQQIIQPQ